MFRKILTYVDKIKKHKKKASDLHYFSVFCPLCSSTKVTSVQTRDMHIILLDRKFSMDVALVLLSLTTCRTL